MIKWAVSDRPFFPLIQSMETPPDSFRIIYQDDAIIAVHKPSGLLTIQDGYDAGIPCLKNLIRAEFGNIWVVHRLDKETSGVILFARTPEAHKDLNAQFEARSIHKAYHALITGYPTWSETIIDSRLKVNGDRKHRTTINPTDGKPALTRVSVQHQFSSGSLVIARPETGYTHQIRAHLASIGHPILGDKLYHSLLDNTPDFPAPRLMLHAFEINFLHPTTHMFVKFNDPYPPDFADLTSSDNELRPPIS